MGLFNFEFDGRTRRFVFFLPPDWPDHYGDIPLVVGLHGAGQSTAEFAANTEIVRMLAGGFTGYAPRIAALLPQGLSSAGLEAGQWNTGWAPNAAVEDADDVGFIVACIDRLSEKLQDDFVHAAPLDGASEPPRPVVGPFSRVFCMGFSAGGGMAYRLASEVPGLLDAIAVVGGAGGGWRYARDFPSVVRRFLWDPPAGPLQTSVLHIHGSADRNVPFNGGPSQVKQDLLAPWGVQVQDEYVPHTNSQDDSLQPWLRAVGKDLQSLPTFDRTGEVAPSVVETEWSDERVVTVGTSVQVVPASWRIRRVVHPTAHVWPNAARDGWDATPYIFDWLQLLL